MGKFRLYQIVKDRFENFLTIQFEIMFAIVLISISTSLIIGVYYQHNVNVIFEEKIKAFSQQIVEQVGDRVDFEFAQLNRMMDILISYAITTAIPQDENRIKNEYLTMKQSERMITNIKHTDSSISGIFMLGKNNMLFSATSGTDRKKLFGEPWIKKLFSMETGKKITTVHNADYMYINIPDYRNPVVSIAQKINRYDEKEIGIDIIQLDLKYSYFADVFKVLNREDRSTIFIIDRNDEIIYHPDFNLVGHQISETVYGLNNTKGMLSVVQPLENVPWRIVGKISTEDIVRRYDYIRKASFAIIFLSIIAAVITSFYLSKRITKPLVLMVAKMKEVSIGNFEQFSVPTRNVDLQILIKGFDKMVGRINLLMEEKVQQETEIVTTELNALKSQINSHFLYNSLEVIRGIALDNKVESIAEIAYALSKLFRYSINKSNDLVTLEQEFDIIKGYVTIHQYRYVNRFKVEYDIDNKILNFRIVRFIIQPIIENSIRYGVEGSTKMGLISITAFQKDNKIIIRVRDNGIGITSEQLIKMNDALEKNMHRYEDIVSVGTGVGLLNVNSRIKLYYGDKYGVKLYSKLNQGTTVEIIVPLIV